MSHKKVAIIGAGFGGLAAAYDLRMRGYDVEIFDQASHPGGLASGFKREQWEWSVEKYYHHWFASDRHMLGFIRELGWSDQVFFPRPYTVLYDNGKFYPFDSILTAILNPVLGWGINKIRFGLVGLYLKLTRNWRNLEGFTTEQWMRRWAGTWVYEKMWEPLLQGKFGDRYMHLVNMAWMWARLHARTTRLGTFRGGFQTLADKLAERLREMGVTLNLEISIERIDPVPDGRLDVCPLHGNPIRFDACLVTSSPQQLAKMVNALPDSYLQGLLSLKHMGAVVLVTSLKHALSPEGYYWYNLPKSAGFPFLALVEHTNFVPAAHFNGEHILYAGDYLDPDHQYFRLSKQQILDRFMPGFKRINPAFDPQWINESWLFRTEYAQPVPFVGHSKNIPDIPTPIKGLYFASMSQVYPWDRGTNFAVEIGRRAADLMMVDLEAIE